MNPSSAIEVLIASGLTESQIGALVGARQSTINRIRHGRQKPSYDVGVALVRLAEALPANEEPPQAEAA
jgi:transcriptional regulator with XRE-family HTH domain